jgi:hypothetical protein
VEKEARGHVVVERTMRCTSHPDVWALGDCACIPTPEPYPCSGARHDAFALTMTLALGIKEPLDFSVFSAAAGSLLLAACPTSLFSVDHLRRPASPRAARRDQLDLP